MQRINSPPGDKVKLQQMGMTMNDIPYIVALLTYSQDLCDNYRFGVSVIGNMLLSVGSDVYTLIK